MPEKTAIVVNTGDFTEALKAYRKATGKDWPDILNRAGGNLSLRSVQKTEKATHARMKTTRTFDPDGPRSYRQQFYFAWSRQMGWPTDRNAVRKLYRKRRSSRAYISAGFLKPAKDFGKKTRSRPFRGGDAARGRGIKAKVNRLSAEAHNFADGADTVGAAGARAAMQFVANDMARYAVRKMQKTGNKYFKG